MDRLEGRPGAREARPTSRKRLIREMYLWHTNLFSFRGWFLSLSLATGSFLPSLVQGRAFTASPSTPPMAASWRGAARLPPTEGQRDHGHLRCRRQGATPSPATAICEQHDGARSPVRRPFASSSSPQARTTNAPPRRLEPPFRAASILPAAFDGQPPSPPSTAIRGLDELVDGERVLDHGYG